MIVKKRTKKAQNGQGKRDKQTASQSHNLDDSTAAAASVIANDSQFTAPTAITPPDPAPPPDLSARARDTWLATAPLLPLDRRNMPALVLLRAYCEAEAAHHQASEVVNRAGLLLRSGRGRNATAKSNPALRIQETKSAEMSRLAARLGLLPTEAKTGAGSSGTKSAQTTVRKPVFGHEELAAKSIERDLATLDALVQNTPTAAADGPSATTKPAAHTRTADRKGHIHHALQAQGHPDVGDTASDIRRHLFISEYLLCGVPHVAAERAGIPAKYAHARAAQWLKDPRVIKAISDRLRNVAERTGVSVEYVLNKMRTMVERCMTDMPVVDKRTGEPTGHYTFDSRGANEALRMLGNYLRMFAEVVETGEFRKDPGQMSTDEQLDALRKLRLLQGGKKG